jgi:hypothetical protein
LDLVIRRCTETLKRLSKYLVMKRAGSLFSPQEPGRVDASSAPCRPVNAGQGAKAKQAGHASGQPEIE